MAQVNVSGIYRALGATARMQNEQVNVVILVDASAPAALIETVKLLFTPVHPRQVKLAVDTYDEQAPEVRPTMPDGSGDKVDVAVLVAGASTKTGHIYTWHGSLEIPCVVIAEDVAIVADMAQANARDIAVSDLIAFDENAHALTPDGLDLEEGKNFPDTDFSRDLGGWICDHCRDKKLAFAHAFPFVRRPLATVAVRATSAENAAVGAIAFIPGADMPVMTLNQAKMILQIAAAYGQTIDLARAKELAGVVAGGFLLRAVARQVVGAVPGLGWAIKGGIGYTGTLAMGRAATEYFANGGDVKTIATKAQGALEKVSDRLPFINLPFKKAAEKDDDESIAVEPIVVEPMVSDVE